MRSRSASTLAVIGFLSAFALFCTTVTSRLGLPIRHMGVGALALCSLWLAVGFWLSAKGALASGNDTCRQLGRFGLYIHGIAIFSSSAGLESLVG